MKRKEAKNKIKNKIIGSFVTPPEYPNHIIREMLKFSLKQKTWQAYLYFGVELSWKGA